ncbi:site-specific tyrosine recombinase XerD [Clostridium ihumii]|uniref:site-specific tyrosine recombinase XerD n=1 Tax=Clostridium ihumii TaxID=1470356 RepID=UPI0005908F42|nr:site-specific tyrosine recombinase XerD [Clostridium ihumii]
MNKLLKLYVEQMQNKNLSYNTIEAYVRDISNFISYLEESEESLESINTDAIILYVEKLRKEGKANTSIIRNIVSIRNFYKYLVINKFVDEDPTLAYDLPRNKKEIPEILTIEEVERLLEAPDDDYKGLRDKAMLEIMYATGTKVSELLNLTMYDKNLELSYIRVKEKHDEERIIPLGRIAVKYLKKYLEVRDELNINKLDYIFLNSKGQKMTRQGFWKIIKKYAEDASINKHVNANTLRHSFAVHLLQNGADIKSVQELLGHNSMTATQIYSFISRQNKLEEVYKKAHPRA